MADERPFMPPPPRELRDLPPRPPQPQPQPQPQVQPETMVEPVVEKVPVHETEKPEIQEKKTELVVQKKKKEKKPMSKKPLYWLGFLLSVGAAVALIILFLMQKQ